MHFRMGTTENEMNDNDRDTWVLNDEGLYDAWKRSRLPRRRFIRENRQLIDEVAGHVANGRKRQHYLKYGA